MERGLERRGETKGDADSTRQMNGKLDGIFSQNNNRRNLLEQTAPADNAELNALRRESRFFLQCGITCRFYAWQLAQVAVGAAGLRKKKKKNDCMSQSGTFEETD